MSARAMTTCPHCHSTNPTGALECRECRRSLAFPEKARTIDSLAEPTQEHELRQTVTPDRIGGRFQLLELIGEGGAGKVYQARDLKLGQDIALKMLGTTLGSDAEAEKYFKREIISARKVTHPNVVRIYDFGETDDDAFISMELLTGGTLADRIADEPLPVAEALQVGAAVADGLAAAHEQGVVHRDLKPGNILFSEDGVPKIADFGIARLLTAETTQTVGFRGTPYYMSPEQADGRPVTRESDIYSLGIVLYEMLTGTRPFRSDSLAKLAVMHVKEPPPSLRSIRSDLPPAVERIVLKCLEKRPERRYHTATALARDLRRLHADLLAGRVRNHRPRRNLLVALGAVVLVAAAAVAGRHAIEDRIFASARETPSATATSVPSEATPTATPAETRTAVALAASPTAEPSARVTHRATRRVTHTPRNTPRPTPVRTPRPTPATPRPTPRTTPRVTARPTRLPASGASGTLRLTAAPWAVMRVDGKVVSREGPWTGKVAAGPHVIEFTNPGLQATRKMRVNVDANGRINLHFDATEGTIERQ